MELGIPMIAIPAIVALLFKGAIYVYARFSRTHNLHTRLYLLFLFALSLQNISEIFVFHSLNVEHVMPYVEVNMFYAATIIALAFLFHLSTSLAIKDQQGLGRHLPIFIYLWATVLEILLFSSKLLIKDLQTLDYGIGLTATRVPGPLYLLFVLYALGIFTSVIAMSIYGARKQDTVQRRLKNSALLLAIVPMAVLSFLVLGLLQFGIKWMNASLTFPFAISYFLAVTAYGIYQHRLFDIEFFIPWSKVRKRKTAFYERIRATIAEIADLTSVNQVVNRLADTLRCPVALIGGKKPVMALAGESFVMARFPIGELQKISRIVVANEISEAMPEMHALMQRHKVAAIVPYHTHSEAAASWMLLGERFSEEVYTPLDFRVVEELFDRLGDLFLDKLLLMRNQLADAQKEMHQLHQRLASAWEELESTRKENQRLRLQNAQLLRQHAGTVGLTLMNNPPADAPADTRSTEPLLVEEKTLDDYVAEFEARIIEQVLERCDGNKAQAARLLGMRPNTLHYKIERYGLSDKNDKK